MSDSSESSLHFRIIFCLISQPPATSRRQMATSNGSCLKCLALRMNSILILAVWDVDDLLISIPFIGIIPRQTMFQKYNKSLELIIVSYLVGSSGVNIKFWSAEWSASLAGVLQWDNIIQFYTIYRVSKKLWKSDWNKIFLKSIKIFSKNIVFLLFELLIRSFFI